MLINDLFYGWVAPDITVQNLAGEFLYVLNINHQPLVGSPAGIAGLQSTQNNAIIYTIQNKVETPGQITKKPTGFLVGLLGKPT